MKSTDSLIPEGFDLEQAKRAKSTTPEDQSNRCPECESVQVYSKGERHGREREFETEYSCRHCGEHFDDPIRGGRSR